MKLLPDDILRSLRDLEKLNSLPEKLDRMIELQEQILKELKKGHFEKRGLI